MNKTIPVPEVGTNLFGGRTFVADGGPNSQLDLLVFGEVEDFGPATSLGPHKAARDSTTPFVIRRWTIDNSSGDVIWLATPAGRVKMRADTARELGKALIYASQNFERREL